MDAQTRAELEAVARRGLGGERDVVAPAGWVTTDVPAERVEWIYELNRLAHEFFTSSYPTSWAARHLQERFGSDLTDDPRFTPGYAPAGWNALVTVLRRAGASDDELVIAGLGTLASTGQLIDRFRDRLVLPIRDEHGIVGFVGRRNPRHDHNGTSAVIAGWPDRYGPKYLNTTETPLYRKGEHLFGMADAAGGLAAGAVPVLVEGPLDAIAVTRAGDGHHVGVATLGTALTDAQADRLIPHLNRHASGVSGGVIVGTDPDLAGRRAAARAYWMLTARGGAPGQLRLPEGLDPADLYTQDPDLLRQHLAHPAGLAASLVEDVLTAWAPRLDSVAGRVGAARDAISVLAALPPTTILEPATQLAHTLDLMPSTVYAELADAVHAWTVDPHAQARHRIQHPLPSTARDADAHPARGAQPAALATGPDRAATPARLHGLHAAQPVPVETTVTPKPAPPGHVPARQPRPVRR